MLGLVPVVVQSFELVLVELLMKVEIDHGTPIHRIFDVEVVVG